MPREMLKLRKGDAAIMIKKDGKIEMAGIDNKPLVDEKGMISPVILFAAAWVTKDKTLMGLMVENFKTCVRNSVFGPGAKEDLELIEKSAASAAVTNQVSNEEPEYEFNQTPEEKAKQEMEEARLRNLAADADPRVQRQMELMKKGAKSISTKPMEHHKLPDLPVEQTMVYQKASPEEQKRMKEEEQKKKAASAAVTLEPIEEGVK